MANTMSQANMSDLVFGDVDNLAAEGESSDEQSGDEGLEIETGSEGSDSGDETEGGLEAQEGEESTEDSGEDSDTGDDSSGIGSETETAATTEQPQEFSDIDRTPRKEIVQPKSVTKIDPKALIKDKEGKEYHLDTVFIKKIDGKKQEVSLRKALDNYAGEIAIEARFAEANKIKQKAEVVEKRALTEVKHTKDLINQILECTKHNNTRGAIDAMAELTGHDKQRAWEEFSAAQKALRESLLKLSDQELAELDRKAETLYWKTNAETAAKRKQDEAKLAEKTDILKKYGLSEEEYNQGENYLLDLQRKGVYNGIISNEAVAYEARNIKIWMQIDEFCRKELPSKFGQNDFYNEVLKDTLQHGYSQEDWKRFFTGLKANPAKKAKPGIQFSKGAVVSKKTIGQPKPVTQSNKPKKSVNDMLFSDL